MGDLRDWEGSSPRFRAIACACATVSLALPSGAWGQAAAPASRAARPASGAAVIQYEESRGNAIIYLEETGGLVAPVAPLVAPRREAAAPAKAPATATAAAPTSARSGVTRLPRLVTRQVADAEGVAGKR